MIAHNKGWFTLLGFLMLSLGFLSIILSMIGLKFSFLTWIDAPGALFGFVVKLILVLGGFVLMYLSRMNALEEE